MQTEFSKEYMRTHKCCYTDERLNACSFMQGDGDTVTLAAILDSEIPLNHKLWFCIYKTQLDTEQVRFTLVCARAVLPIYEAVHPENTRLRACLEAGERCLDGTCSIDALEDARKAAIDYAETAYDAAYTAAYAARAAARAAAYAADNAADNAAAYAARASDAAAYAARAAGSGEHAVKLIYAVKQFYGI